MSTASTIVRSQSGCELLLRCNGTMGRSSVVYSQNSPLKPLIHNRSTPSISRPENKLSVLSLSGSERSSSTTHMECVNGAGSCEDVPLEVVVVASNTNSDRTGSESSLDNMTIMSPILVHQSANCDEIANNNANPQHYPEAGLSIDSRSCESFGEVKVTRVRCSNMQCTDIANTLILCKGCEREYYCSAKCAEIDRHKHSPLCGFKVAYEASMGRVLIALRDFSMGDVVLREPLLMWDSQKETEAPMNFLKAYLSADRETRRKIDDLYTPDPNTDNANVSYAKKIAVRLGKYQAGIEVPEDKPECSCVTRNKNVNVSSHLPENQKDQGRVDENTPKEDRTAENTDENSYGCECECLRRYRIERKFKHMTQDSLVSLMLKRNFNAWSMDPSGTQEGLGYYASMLNHSCDPNVKGGPIAGTLDYTATRAIRKGEQLTVSYFDNSLIFQSLQERREALLASHAFLCCCNRCIGPDLVRPLHCPVRGCDSVCLRISSVQHVDDDPSAGADPGVWVCQDPSCGFQGSDHDGDMPAQISAEKRLLRLANVTESRDDFIYKLRKIESVLPPAHHAYLKLFRCHGLALEDIRAPLVDKETTTFALLELILWRERFMAIHTAARSSQEHGEKWNVSRWYKNRWKLDVWSKREHASESTYNYLIDVWKTDHGRNDPTEKDNNLAKIGIDTKEAKGVAGIKGDVTATLQPNFLTKDPVIMSVNRLLLLNRTKLAIILVLRYKDVATAEEFTDGVVPEGDF